VPVSERDDDNREARTARAGPGGQRPRSTMQMTVVPEPGVDGRLEDRGEIARGGQGTVRKVFDRRLERHAALKAIDPSLADQPDAIGRFLDEARITGQLDHPNIVPIYDLVEEGPSRSFVMKLVEGETLSVRLRKPARDAHDLARQLEMFLKVCDAVAFAHSRGVIHHDLKPQNVMIGEFGQVYVMDWGCAIVRPDVASKPAEARPRRTIVDEPGTVIGTPAYMAPEQALGRTDEIDERTDVFGLGAILYQILTGVPPYNAEVETEVMAMARAGQPRAPQDAARHRTPPPALAAIAMRALARDRADRYPTVLALRDEVQRFLHRGVFFTTRPFPAGTLIVREGDVADEAYVIVSGRCEAFRDERGRRVSLRTLGPGDVFGEAALFDAEPRNASIIAVDDVSAIAVTREVLNQELGLDTWLGTFVRALIGRFRDLDARHAMTRRVTENARIASLIIHHISRAGTWVRAGAVATSWSRLWHTLSPECGIDEEAALAIVARTADLDYDREADQITLELLSMA
jgi:tRNA A-37 threonylcarbamoyl transferase component Bud32